MELLTTLERQKRIDKINTEFKCNVNLIINDTADMFELNPLWLLSIIEIESSWNPYAKRYEPAFEARYLKNSFNPTERRLRATSWGLCQVMGQTARELGYKKAIRELIVPSVNIYYAAKLLKQKRKRYPDGTIRDWVAAYNAGSVMKTKSGGYANQHHIDKFNKALQYFDTVLV